MKPELKQRLQAYIQLSRLDKPVGIWLLLWPTLWGLILAGQGHPPIVVTIIFVLGTILMRSAGCVLNDIADKEVDGHVERTQYRPLATGLVTIKEAYGVAGILVLLAFILVCQLNLLTCLMTVPALLLAVTYPYTKRFLAIPQAYLGLAFGFGIPMAYAAIEGQVPAIAWLLLLTNVFWSVAYDTEYAMVDKADDLKIGIRSSAITFGEHDVLAIMLCYLYMMLLWGAMIMISGLAWPAWLGMLVAVGQITKQYQRIKKRLPAECFQAFLDNVWIGLSLTVGLWLSFFI